MVILAFDNIAKSYGDTPALRGVSFDVHAGEIFGLLGPNGAGQEHAHPDPHGHHPGRLG